MNGKLSKVKIVFLLFLIVGTFYILRNHTPEVYTTNSGYIFGTQYNIKYKSVEDLHNEIKATLMQVDNSLSMFNKSSIISAFNSNRDTIANEMFTEVFNLAQEISAKTDGAFDITVAPLVNAWGFGTKSQGPRPKNQDINLDSIKAFVGYEKIQLNNHRIEKNDERITLDASAIAKGFACDVIANFLRQNGCTNLLVDIGGEVVLQGVNDKGNAWRVGITRPTIDATGMEKELQEVIESHKLCMATSGNYLQYYFVDGQRRSHTINPHTGCPVEHSFTASSCMRADALATACMVLGEEEALQMIAQTSDAACYLIVADSDSLRIVTSERWNFTEFTTKSK